jgi:hypothetical protein
MAGFGRGLWFVTETAEWRTPFAMKSQLRKLPTPTPSVSTATLIRSGWGGEEWCVSSQEDRWIRIWGRGLEENLCVFVRCGLFRTAERDRGGRGGTATQARTHLLARIHAWRRLGARGRAQAPGLPCRSTIMYPSGPSATSSRPSSQPASTSSSSSCCSGSERPVRPGKIGVRESRLQKREESGGRRRVRRPSEALGGRRRKGADKACREERSGCRRHTRRWGGGGDRASCLFFLFWLYSNVGCSWDIF